MHCQLKTYQEKLVTTSRKPLECKQIFIIQQFTKLYEGSCCWKSECQVLFFVLQTKYYTSVSKTELRNLVRRRIRQQAFFTRDRRNANSRILCWHLIFAPNRNQYKQTRWSLHRRSKTWFNRYFTVNLLFSIPFYLFVSCSKIMHSYFYKTPFLLINAAAWYYTVAQIVAIIFTQK